MEYVPTGQFFGQTHHDLRVGHVRLTDTVYTHAFVDWHYHQYPYFTFLLAGQLIEKNRRHTTHCRAGDLLFHNWQEPHANTKPNGFARGFHLEVEDDFLHEFDLDLKGVAGNLTISDVTVKLRLYSLLKELHIQDSFSALTIQAHCLDILTSVTQSAPPTGKPTWLAKATELLHDLPVQALTLSRLAQELNRHPVHLSRDFPRYFRCSLGEYLRKIRIGQALALLPDASLSLTDIAFRAGFADQSHFIRCFRAQQQLTPGQYRRQVLQLR